MAAIQIVKMDHSIIDWFYMMMDLGNESLEYREVAVKEFKENILRSLQTGPGKKEIIWIKEGKEIK